MLEAGDRDEPLSESNLIKVVQYLQQLRDSGQPYVDTIPYNNLVAYLKARSAGGNPHGVVGSGNGPSGSLSLPLPSSRIFPNISQQPQGAQPVTATRDVMRTAAEPGPGRLQGKTLPDQVVHTTPSQGQAPFHAQQSLTQGNPRTGTSAEERAERTVNAYEIRQGPGQLQVPELSHQVQSDKQPQSFSLTSQINSHQMRPNEDKRTDAPALQAQRQTQVTSSRLSSEQRSKPQQINLNLQYGTGGSPQGPQFPPGSTTQGPARGMELTSQGPATTHGPLTSQYISQSQPQHVSSTRKTPQGGVVPHQQAISQPKGGPSAVELAGTSSSTQDNRMTGYASPSRFGNGRPGGTSGPFLGTPIPASTFGTFHLPGGPMIDSSGDRPSVDSSRPQLSIPSTTANDASLMDIVPRGSSQGGINNFQLQQLRQQLVGRPGLPSQKTADSPFGTAELQQLQHQQLLHLIHQQALRASVPSQKTGDDPWLGPLPQQQGIRPSIQSMKPEDTSFPSLSQQRLQQPQALQHLQHPQQVVRPNLTSFNSGEINFPLSSTQSFQQALQQQQQQMLQIHFQQQAARASQPSQKPTETPFPSPAAQLQKLHIQLLQQQQQALQQHQQQYLHIPPQLQQQNAEQKPQQHQQLEQPLAKHQQPTSHQQPQRHHQQQLSQHQNPQPQQHHLQEPQHVQQQQQRPKSQQQNSKKSQNSQLQRKQQRQPQSSQSQQQRVVQMQQPQPQLVAKAQQLHRPQSSLQDGRKQDFGFTNDQLQVLRQQILAFRRIKKNEAMSEKFLEEITPKPLKAAANSKQVAAGSQASASDRGASPGCTSNSLIASPAANSAASEANDRKLLLPSSKENAPIVQASAGGKEISPLTQESGAVLSEPSAAKISEASILAKQERQVPSDLGKVEIEKLAGADVAVKSEPGTLSTTVTTEVPNTVLSKDKQALLKPSNFVPILDAASVVCSQRGPLFDYPPVSKPNERSSSSADVGFWGEATVLGYDVRHLLLEEGVRLVDRKRRERLKRLEELLSAGAESKMVSSEILVKLRIEHRKLRLMELQSRVRDEVEDQQQEIMAMGERAYRKFVRLCERQRGELSRQMVMLQKANREKQLKALFQWRKKLLEAQWASRDSRITRNRGVAKYHERMMREFSKKKDDDRTKRMEALKNNDVAAYREMLRQQQTQIPGDSEERFEVLSSFLTQTEEYLQALGGKITAVKYQQEQEEAALQAAAEARDRGFSEEEIQLAAARAGADVSRSRWAEAEENGVANTSTNRYYNLAHAVNEQVLRQPSMLRAGILRDYQLVGLQWMLSLYNNRLNGILADEMGLGKTVQVMALIAYLMEFKGNYGPHLIIVPNAVIVNWKSELALWLPVASCIFYVGGKEARTKIFTQEVMAMKFNVLVTTYEFIMRDRSKLSKVDWKYLIIDEAQRMKDRESRLARDLDRFRCQRRLLLTGTPLQNDLNELWSLLNLLLPDVFDSSKAFSDWFAKPFQRDAATGQSEDDDWLETEKKVIVIHRLHQILEPFMLRRRVEDVEGSLPAKVSIVLKCKMSAHQAAIYDWVKATGTLRLDPLDEAQRVNGNSKRQIRAYAPLQNKCMELRKVCNHPFLNYPPPGNNPYDNIVRSCGKLWILDRILVKLHKTGHRVLLFSTMTKLLDILEEYLLFRRFLYRRIDGTTTLEAREAGIVEFNKPGSEIFIFLLSIRAAGRGLNLQSADTVVIYDPDPNPKNEEQAVARAHRIGQKREVRVVYMEAVVETLLSYQKEDEIRDGGTIDSDDEGMSGKDPYMGSVESLVRNKIQQHKIDMADEVINAGRFDQRTSQEERRLTLEALLHDEERYQETVHDVATLQEVNRMIARSDEEVELFDRMDKDDIWPGELVKHSQVSKWLRVGSDEVNAAIAATSKQAMKQGIIGLIGTRAEEERVLLKAAKLKGAAAALKRKAEADDTRPADLPEKKGGSKKVKRKRSTEVQQVPEGVPRSDAAGEGGIRCDTVATKADRSSLDGGAKVAVGQKHAHVRPAPNDVELEEGEMKDEEYVGNGTEAVKDVGEDRGYSSNSLSSDAERKAVKGPSASLDVSSRPAQNGQPKRFGSLAAIENRPMRQHQEDEDLEEGEIAVSGDESQDAERWSHREHPDGEQVAQPQQRKRKRSNRSRRMTHIVEPSNNGNNNGAVSVNHMYPFPAKFPRFNPGPTPVPRINDVVDTPYDRHLPWSLPANIRPLVPPPSTSVVPFDNGGAAHGQRLVFKPPWVNSFPEPLEDTRLTHANMLAHANAMRPNIFPPNNVLSHNNSLASWNATARMPENQQKKCKAVLGKLQGVVNKEGRTVAALFMELPKRSENPDYYRVISRPIDARIIEHRLDHFEYPGVIDFAADVQLMLQNAAQYNRSTEIQADAKRLHALFFQRMGLQFPDVDFSPVRTKVLVTPAHSSSPARVSGSHKKEPLEISEAPRSGSEPAVGSTTTRWRTARFPARHGGLSSDAASSSKEVAAVTTPKKAASTSVVKESPVRKEKTKKGKDLRKAPDLPLSNNDVGESRLGDGQIHPVDLVVLKKKRNGRERVASKATRSKLFSDGPTESSFREPSGNSVPSPRHNVSNIPPPIVHQKTRPLVARPGPLGFSKVGKRTAKPKLKVSWIDPSIRKLGNP